MTDILTRMKEQAARDMAAYRKKWCENQPGGGRPKTAPKPRASQSTVKAAMQEAAVEAFIRANPRVKHRQIAEATGFTSGAVSNAIGKLKERGIVVSEYAGRGVNGHRLFVYSLAPEKTALAPAVEFRSTRAARDANARQRADLRGAA